MKERYNRVSEWASRFKDECDQYRKFSEAMQTMKENVFDDDLIEKSL